MNHLNTILLASSLAVIAVPAASASPYLDYLGNATDGLYEPFPVGAERPSTEADDQLMAHIQNATDGLYEPEENVHPFARANIANMEVVRHHSGWIRARESSLENVRVNLQDIDD